MQCIVGLGNPGKKYKKTRHNIGFQVIDELTNRHHVKMKSKFKCNYGLHHDNSDSLLFVKPQTFMNLSGEGVQSLMQFFNIEHKDLLVIYDDLDLPAGKIRLREKGGHGGHNGIRSIIQHTGSNEFKRLRIGIGRPVDATPVVNYVLKPFPKVEKPLVSESVERAADACEMWINQSFTEVMNKFNQKNT